MPKFATIKDADEKDLRDRIQGAKSLTDIVYRLGTPDQDVVATPADDDEQTELLRMADPRLGVVNRYLVYSSYWETITLIVTEYASGAISLSWGAKYIDA